MKTISSIIMCMFIIIQFAFAQNSDRELVEIKEIIPDIIIDLKYSTTDNFCKQKLYTIDVAYISYGAAKSLKAVQDSLRKLGLGLKIWDAYRPSSVQALMWEIFPDPTFVAPPGESSHNRGAAIDLTLIDLSTGNELEMPTQFDYFGLEAHHDYMDLPANVIANRQRLKLIMEFFDFEPYIAEWWHYTHKASKNYPALYFQMR